MEDILSKSSRVRGPLSPEILPLFLFIVFLKSSVETLEADGSFRRKSQQRTSREKFLCCLFLCVYRMSRKALLETKNIFD